MLVAKKMNFFNQLSSSKFLSLLIIFDIHLTFGQDHTSTSVFPNLANSSSQNAIQPDSNITWIKINTVFSNDTALSKHSDANCTTVVENTSKEDQQTLDTGDSSRRRRRKRRRNKYKSWNQPRRQPENSYKKHSTRVQLNKPVQFLIPPDYQENLIAKESNYYKNNGNERENFIDNGIQKKISPPIRYLLPPFFDPSFVTTTVTPPPQQQQQQQSKKPKYVEWSPNTTNRGSTKFKHTVYYSDSGNEILSNYQVVSTTPTPRVKSTTTVDDRKPIPARIESPPNNIRRQEYRPIVVQPTTSQYYTTETLLPQNSTIGYTSREPNENRVNNFVSSQVARAGMQVVNMSTYQRQQQSQLFQSQYYQTTQNYKQFAQPSALQVQSQQQQSQPQPQQINYQSYQQMHLPTVPDHQSQVSYQLQNEHLRPTTQTYNQQYPQQNYQHQTTYSRPPEIRTTTPAIEFTTLRTTTSSDNFKGLEIAESKYFSDLPSEQEFTAALQNDGQVIPGIAGKDYPVFDQVLLQKRRFACRGLEGYFADVTSRCQVFYICNGDGAGEPMLCPNGTLFSQELLVCDWWYNVDC